MPSLNQTQYFSFTFTNYPLNVTVTAHCEDESYRYILLSSINLMPTSVALSVQMPAAGKQRQI